jgi:hypothetical protein
MALDSAIVVVEACCPQGASLLEVSAFRYVNVTRANACWVTPQGALRHEERRGVPHRLPEHRLPNCLHNEMSRVSTEIKPPVARHVAFF